MPAKILIVEDEAIVALDLQRRLISMGYEVPHIAASHDRALSVANEIKPDVVLMDIHISGKKDGIETAKKILAPVIYLTAYAEEKTLARARETRPYGFLVKPFSERELHATIQMTLERIHHDQTLQSRHAQLSAIYDGLNHRGGIEPIFRDLNDAEDKVDNNVFRNRPELQEQTVSANWQGKIHSALTEKRFMLYKQKITPLSGQQGYSEHAEFLLRLIDKDGTVIPTAAVIAYAQRFGLMNMIDQWVIRNAFAYIGEQAHQSTALFSINLSGDTLNDEEAAQFIYDQLTKYSLSGTCICFEISEKMASLHPLTTRQFILAMRALGCQFALDSFGSGLPVFSHLRQLPVDFVKIDGCFIRNMVDDAIDATMASAINDIGHVLGLKTIAVHVEDDGILSRLNTMGVDYVQGFRIGHPEPITM